MSQLTGKFNGEDKLYTDIVIAKDIYFSDFDNFRIEKGTNILEASEKILPLYIQKFENKTMEEIEENKNYYISKAANYINEITKKLAAQDFKQQVLTNQKDLQDKMDFGFKGIEKVLTKIGEKLNE
jgi:hypothetical protein